MPQNLSLDQAPPVRFQFLITCLIRTAGNSILGSDSLSEAFNYSQSFGPFCSSSSDTLLVEEAECVLAIFMLNSQTWKECIPWQLGGVFFLLWTVCPISAWTCLHRPHTDVAGESEHRVDRCTDVLEHLAHVQPHCGTSHPSQNRVAKPSCGSTCDDCCLGRGFRASRSYRDAKIKLFGNILSNPDRFCNQNQQCMAWISGLGVSPLLEKSNSE